eukprot:5549212-Amphidinium_carterae.1
MVCLHESDQPFTQVRSSGVLAEWALALKWKNWMPRPWSAAKARHARHAMGSSKTVLQRLGLGVSAALADCEKCPSVRRSSTREEHRAI